MSVSFPEQVSAVSPLDGDAIDGTPRPKPRRQRQPPRERMDASRSWGCRNPQCDHATWSDIEYARHMGREFRWVAEALVRQAPESPEALLLTRGVIMRDLTDAECREGATAYARLMRTGAELSVEMMLRSIEYSRRVNAGTLEKLADRSQWAPRQPKEKCKHGHKFTPENTYVRPDGSRVCKKCRAAIKRRPETRGRENARLRNRRASDPEWRDRDNARRRKP